MRRASSRVLRSAGCNPPPHPSTKGPLPRRIADRARNRGAVPSPRPGRRIEGAGREPGDHEETCERARNRVHARAAGGGGGGPVAGHFARRRCRTCSGATLAGGATAGREGCRRAMQVRLGHAHTRQPSSLITGLGLAHTRAAAQARSRRQPWVYPFHTCSQPHRPPQHMRPPGRCAASRRGDGLDRTGPCRAGPGQRSTGQRRSRGFSGRRL